MVAWRTLIGLGVAVLAWSVAREPAHASCAAPPPKVLWTYPADGDRDVPIDSVLWVISNAWGAPSLATLNGKPLDAMQSDGVFDAVSFAPGTLQPDTSYVLHLEYSSWAADLDAGDSPAYDVAFQTGSSRSKAPPKPFVAGYRASSGLDAMHPCADVIAAQDCFDQGQNTLLAFDVVGDGALAWLVNGELTGRTLWPQRCGDPALFTDQRFDYGCVDVQTLGVGGKLSDKATFCIPALPAPDAGVRGGATRDGGTQLEKDAGRPVPPASAPGGATSDAGAAPLYRDKVIKDEDGCNASGAGTARAWLWPLLALCMLARRARRGHCVAANRDPCNSPASDPSTPV